MKVALDIDDTLFKNTVLRDVLNEHDFTGTYSWDLHEIPENVLSIVRSRFADPMYMCTVKPFDGNPEVIKDMHSKGFELYAVTSRLESVHAQTRDMIKEHFPEIRDVYFGNETKRDILIDQGFNMLIDDSPKYIKEIMDTDIQKILISNSHTPYNFDLRDHSYGKILVFSSLVKFWDYYKNLI